VLKQMPVRSIRVDNGILARNEVNADVVRAYAMSYKCRRIMPPVTVFWDGEDVWLADGAYRLRAIAMLKEPTILCDVRVGTRAEAVWFAAGANKTHAQPLRHKEIRRAMRNVIVACPNKTNLAIAMQVGVEEREVITERFYPSRFYDYSVTKKLHDNASTNCQIAFRDIERPREIAFVRGYARTLQTVKRKIDRDIKRQRAIIDDYKIRLMNSHSHLEDTPLYCDIKSNVVGAFGSSPASLALRLDTVRHDHIIIADYVLAFHDAGALLANVARWHKQGVHVHFGREKLAAKSVGGRLMLDTLRDASYWAKDKHKRLAHARDKKKAVFYDSSSAEHRI